MTLKDMQEAVELFDGYPEFKDYAPRKYVVPGGYTNPRHFSVLHFDGKLAHDQKMELNPTQRISVMLGNELKKIAYPVYFVSPELARVALQTQPPKDIVLSKIHWPLPVLFFQMPRLFLKEQLGRALNYGLIGRIGQIDGEQIMTLAECEESNEKLSWFHTHCPVKYTIADITEEDMMNEVDEKTALVGGYKPQEDEDYGKAVSRLLYNLVLIMTASPALIEPGSCVRKATGRPGRTQELWNPNFFGRTYRIKQGLAAPERTAGDVEALSGGHHASPRTHWRRGHFRHQRHGIGSLEIKVLWIEPLLVNAPAPLAPYQ
jgi:hypothetical protein